MEYCAYFETAGFALKTLGRYKNLQYSRIFIDSATQGNEIIIRIIIDEDI